MPDWQSLDEIARDFQIIDKVVHGLLGLYVWEFLTTLDFEWELVTGKRKFKWPMITYFFGRYFQLFAFIGITIALDTPTPLNCQAVYQFSAFMNLGALTLASINLATRTLALLDYNRILMLVVAVPAAGQAALVILSVTDTKGTFIATPGACVPLGEDLYQTIFFLYTTVFNVLLLVATSGILFKKKDLHANNRHVMAQNVFVRLFVTDGLFYFIVALVFDIVVLVFLILNLNKPMNLLFQIPTATFSTIVGCRAVKDLVSVSSRGSATNSTGRSTGTSSNNRHISNGNLRGIQSTIQSQPGVHVQMDTFTHMEDSYGEKKEVICSENEPDLEANKGAAL